MELQKNNYFNTTVEMYFIVYYAESKEEWRSVCLNNDKYEGYSFSKYGSVINMFKEAEKDLLNPNISFDEIFIKNSYGEWLGQLMEVDEFEKSSIFVLNKQFKKGIYDKETTSN